MSAEASEAGEVSTHTLVDTKDDVAVRRRRRWPEAVKRQIVAETRAPGASVSVVARRHDVNANQVFRWRQQYAAAGPDGEIRLVPVQPSPASTWPAASPAATGVIEIELVSGARVRVSGAVDGAVLSQVLERLK
jgi:transposase